MKKEDVQIGATYEVKVTNAFVPVTIIEAHPNGGWNGTNQKTGKAVRIKSAQRLRRCIDAGTPADGDAAEPKGIETTQPGDDQAETCGTMSLLDAAAHLLAQTEEAMRCQDLVDKARESGLWAPKRGGKTPDRTLYAAILREINTKAEASRFRKVERGHFALNA